MAPSLVDSQALPCTDAAGCCLVGPGHEVAGGGILGGPEASAGSLVGGVRVPKSLGRLPTHWQVKPDPGVSAGPPAGRARSWSLAAGPRDPRTPFRSLGSWGWRFLIQLGMGSRVSRRLRWPASGQDQGPAGPRVGSGLWDGGFLASGVCPPGG